MFKKRPILREFLLTFNRNKFIPVNSPSFHLQYFGRLVFSLVKLINFTFPRLFCQDWLLSTVQKPRFRLKLCFIRGSLGDSKVFAQTSNFF